MIYLSGVALIIIAIVIIWWIADANRNAANEALQVADAHHVDRLEALHAELERALEP